MTKKIFKNHFGVIMPKADSLWSNFIAVGEFKFNLIES